MKKLVLMVVATISLVACQKETEYKTVTVEVPAPVAEPTEVEQLIELENEFRELQGQLPLTQGLTCSIGTLTVVPSLLPSSLPSGSKSFVLKEEINQPQSSVNDGLNLLPTALRQLYKTSYMLRCSGVLVVTEPGNYSFELTSDDGSKLVIGGTTVVINDGHHSTVTKVGAKVLNRGVHSFRLDYMQANGEQSLILKANGEVVPAANMYR